MRSCLKTVFILIGGTLVLAGVGALLFITQLDTLPKDKIEKSLTDIFHSPSTVESIHVSALTQGIEFNHVTITNPDTFKSGPALEFEQVQVQFDIKTIFSDKPVVRRIVLVKPVVYLRYELGEGTNLGRLSKQIEQGETVEILGKDRKEFFLEKLYCEGVKMKLSSNLVPASSVGLDVAPFTIDRPEGSDALDVASVMTLFLHSLGLELANTKGLVKPVASLLLREFQDTSD